MNFQVGCASRAKRSLEFALNSWNGPGPVAAGGSWDSRMVILCWPWAIHLTTNMAVGECQDKHHVFRGSTTTYCGFFWREECGRYSKSAGLLVGERRNPSLPCRDGAPVARPTAKREGRTGPPLPEPFAHIARNAMYQPRGPLSGCATREAGVFLF